MAGWMEAAATAVGASAGVGAFIDFYLGKAGEKRVRSRMETWWLKLSYVRLRSFGHEESLFAAQTVDHLFGSRLFSLRRLEAVIIATGLSAVFSILVPHIFIYSRGSSIRYASLIMFSECLISAAFFAISISFTRAALYGTARLLRGPTIVNLTLALLLLIIQYAVFCLWSPVMATVSFASSYLLTHFSWSSLNTFLTITILKDVIRHAGTYLSPSHPLGIIASLVLGRFSEGDDHTVRLGPYQIDVMLSILPNIGRLLLAVIFTASFLLRPVAGAINTLLARIIESDKPVFTLLFTGAAAVAKGAEGTLRYLLSS